MSLDRVLRCNNCTGSLVPEPHSDSDELFFSQAAHCSWVSLSKEVFVRVSITVGEKYIAYMQ